MDQSFDVNFPQTILSDSENMILQSIKKAYSVTMKPITDVFNFPLNKISVTCIPPPEEGLMFVLRKIENGSVEFRLFGLNNPDKIVENLVIRTLRSSPYLDTPMRYHSPIRSNIVSVKDV